MTATHRTKIRTSATNLALVRKIRTRIADYAGVPHDDDRITAVALLIIKLHHAPDSLDLVELNRCDDPELVRRIIAAEARIDYETPIPPE